MLSHLRMESPSVVLEALSPRVRRSPYTAAMSMARIKLAGKPIAISGASSGIGAATAIACAKAGMPVGLMARRMDRLEQLADDIRHAGGRAIAFQGDVADAAACEQFIAKTVEAFGPLYSVYANAGYGIEQSILGTTDRELRAIFETNFFGTLNLIRPGVEAMQKRETLPGEPRGHVLICSSCLAKQALPYYGAYSATKAAQHHIGRAMRLELEPRNIVVSTVHPITTSTELFDLVKRRSGIEKLSHNSPGWLTQTAQFVGERTVACLERPRAEVWTGFRGNFVRLGMAVGGLLPGFMDSVLRGMVRKRESAAASQ